MLIAITVGAKNRQVENSASRKPRMRQPAAVVASHAHAHSFSENHVLLCYDYDCVCSVCVYTVCVCVALRPLQSSHIDRD
jgi:hypothetical protein